MKAFERRFRTIVEEEKRRQKERGSLRRKLTLRSNRSDSVSKRPAEVDASNGELRSRYEKIAAPVENEKDTKDLEMGRRVSAGATEERFYGASAKPPALTIDTSAGTRRSESGKEDDYADLPDEVNRKRGVTFAPTPTTSKRIAPLARLFSMQGVGARHDLPNHPGRINRPATFLSPVEEHETTIQSADLMHRFWIPGIMGRNSHFSNMSFADRERLGGVEYRTLELLIVVVPLYFVAWQALGAIGMGAWVANNGRDLTQANGLDPW